MAKFYLEVKRLGVTETTEIDNVEELVVDTNSVTLLDKEGKPLMVVPHAAYDSLYREGVVAEE